MSVSNAYRSIQKTVAVYEKILEAASEEVFTSTPPQGGWSYAEVYAHLFTSNHSCIQAIDACLKGKAIESNEPMPFPVKMVFLFGRFPPGKFKVPERIKAQVTKISKDEARKLITDFKDRLETITPLINQASKTQKQKHPRLGLLNAVKWYEFIDIHTRHHRKQLDRIGGR